MFRAVERLSGSVSAAGAAGSWEARQKFPNHPGCCNICRLRSSPTSARFFPAHCASRHLLHAGGSVPAVPSEEALAAGDTEGWGLTPPLSAGPTAVCLPSRPVRLGGRSAGLRVGSLHASRSRRALLGSRPGSPTGLAAPGRSRLRPRPSPPPSATVPGCPTGGLAAHACAPRDAPESVRCSGKVWFPLPTGWVCVVRPGWEPAAPKKEDRLRLRRGPQ